MTDKDIAHHVYIEPLTVPVVKNLILKKNQIQFYQLLVVRMP